MEKYGNIIHVSTGDIFRKEENQKITKAYTDRGELVPNQKTIDILKKEIEKLKREHHCDKLILDGFPRTPEQVKLLNQIIDPQKTYVADFKVSDKTAIKRIQNRAQSDGDNAREDDKNPKAM